MKKIIFLFALILLPIAFFAQSFNADKTALTNFLIRMYKHAPLIDVISDWMVRNTVDGAFNLSSNTEMRAKYEQVRIPMFNDKGRAMDARMFATNLRKFLKQQYLIESKVMNKGLGEAVVVIGEK